MDFLTYVKEHQEGIIEEVKKLCKIESVLTTYDQTSSTPFGPGIQEALEYMLRLAKTDDFVVKNVKNHAAHIELGEGKDILGILTHLDVVPANKDGWTTPPFEPVIKDGKIFGRGTSDDKGPTIAAYFAMKFLKDLNVNFHKRVRLIMGTDEETKWRGIEAYFKTEEMPTFGFSPDATFPLIHGEKGIYTFNLEGTYANDSLIKFSSGERYNVVPSQAECELSIDLSEPFKTFLKYNDYRGEIKGNTYIVYGKTAHAMTPNKGLNAAFILADFLNQHLDNDYIKFIHDYLDFDPFGEKLGIDIKDDIMHNFTLNPGIFKYQKDEVMIGINCRYPNGFNLKATALKISNIAKKYKLKYIIQQNIPLHFVQQDDSLIKILMESYQKISNDTENIPYTIGGGTYARALNKGVAFGMVMPGRKEVAHQVNEHIFIDDLIEGTAIYMEAIYALTRKDVKI